MLHLYDECMTRKLQQVFGNVVYASTDEALSKCMQDNNGVLKMPLISVYRTGIQWTDNLDHGEIWQGRRIMLNESRSHILSFSLDVTYQIDIWSVERIHSDGVLCDLIFYLTDYPNLSITVPGLGDEDFSVRITDIESDIDTSSFEDTGRLYRNIITLESTVSVFRTTGETNYILGIDISDSDNLRTEEIIRYNPEQDGEN